MKVDQNTIQKIIHLSRLEFDEKAEQSLLQDVNKILDWVEKLKEIDTEKVKPLTHMSEEVNILREDVVANTLKHEDALINGPKKDSDYFRVPKFLG
ncbi:MAG: Asp-tRNA(Asn)/Glu-tRNA(Gln) amidotransferase subunit GatC [Cytophagaceae bacterium]